jgi:ATP-dependent DNA helicase PIF1
MVDAIYPDIQRRYMDIAYLREWFILTPTNDIADTINSHILFLIPDEERQYLSADSILKPLNTHVYHVHNAICCLGK